MLGDPEGEIAHIVKALVPQAVVSEYEDPLQEVFSSLPPQRDERGNIFLLADVKFLYRPLRFCERRFLATYTFDDRGSFLENFPGLADCDVDDDFRESRLAHRIGLPVCEDLSHVPATHAGLGNAFSFEFFVCCHSSCHVPTRSPWVM